MIWTSEARRNLTARLRGVRTLGLVDQALVSAANFAAVFIIARATSAAELGIYALGLTVVVLLLAAHESLVGAPYIVFCNRRQLQGRELQLYTGSSLIHTVVLAGVATLILGSGLLLIAIGILPSAARPITVALILTVAPAIFRDFARRFALAHSRMVLLLSVDLVVAAGQVGLLVLFAAGGVLDAASAYTALALACFVGSALWFAIVRREILFDAKSAWRHARENWDFGRWVLACSVATVLQGYSVHWVLAIVHGPGATGVFEALRSTANLINPLITGLRNVVGPLSARGYARMGAAGVRRVIVASARPLAGLGALFVLGLAVLGEPFMDLAFGNAYSGYRWALVAVGAANLVFGLSALVDQGLWALERPDLNAKAAAAGLMATVMFAAALVPTLVVLGGGLAYLGGRLIEGAYRYVVLRFVMAHELELARARSRPVPARDAGG